MIKFSGTLSNKCVIEYSKQTNKANALVFSYFTIFILVVTLTLAFFDTENFYYLLCLLGIMIIINLTLLFVPPNSVVFKLPRIVEIVDNQISSATQCENKVCKSLVKKVNNIKVIVDYGDWYYIRFKFDITASVVCQKSLIVEGTIEDFEKLFADKIIRKY